MRAEPMRDTEGCHDVGDGGGDDDDDGDYYVDDDNGGDDFQCIAKQGSMKKNQLPIYSWLTKKRIAKMTSDNNDQNLASYDHQSMIS